VAHDSDFDRAGMTTTIVYYFSYFTILTTPLLVASMLFPLAVPASQLTAFLPKHSVGT
jgi:hypothetical protein